MKDCGNSLEEKADSLNHSSGSLNDKVADSVATTEELSAQIQITHSIVQNVNGEIGNINSAVEEVLHNIAASVETSSQVIKSANVMKGQADNAYDSGQKTLEKTKDSVAEALRSLESLIRINELASEILNIANQTNLLSLNTIVEKNEDISKIAILIQKESEENRELSEQLEKLLSKFEH